MRDDLDRNGSIANLYAAHLLKKGTDRAFVIGFDTETSVTQDWADRPEAIAQGIQSVSKHQGSGNVRTAIFDSLYKTCRDRWNIDREGVTGNFILLFQKRKDDEREAEKRQQEEAAPQFYNCGGGPMPILVNGGQYPFQAVLEPMGPRDRRERYFASNEDHPAPAGHGGQRGACSGRLLSSEIQSTG
jgi:hypothetical protein